jgi:hypothetical protein
VEKNKAVEQSIIFAKLPDIKFEAHTTLDVSEYSINILDGNLHIWRTSPPTKTRG